MWFVVSSDLVQSTLHDLDPTSLAPLANSVRICQLAVVGQNGPVTTSLLALVEGPPQGVVGALGAATSTGSFGVGKGLALILAVSALLLAAMAMGGHLGAASRRRKNRKDRR